MVPEPSDGLLRCGIVVVAAAIIGEDSKLIFCHHITRWLGLDSSPDIADAPFKHCRYSRGNLAILVVLGYLESLAHCELSLWYASHYRECDSMIRCRRAREGRCFVEESMRS